MIKISEDMGKFNEGIKKFGSLFGKVASKATSDGSKITLTFDLNEVEKIEVMKLLIKLREPPKGEQ